MTKNKYIKTIPGKIISSMIAGILMLLFCFSSDCQAGELNDYDSSLPPRLIIKTKADFSNKSYKTARNYSIQTVPVVKKVLDKYHTKSPLSSIVTPGRAVSSNRFKNIYIITLEKNEDIHSLKRELETLGIFEYVEIDQIAEYFEYPDDPLLQHQWSLNNTGQEHYHIDRNTGSYNDELILTGGIEDSDIDALEVISAQVDPASPSVVAIIDSGVDPDHPDLAANIWINPREIPDDGIDNDNNGFIDDINGWNFGDILFGNPDGNNNLTDADGHGTHCAGIAAAVSNNGIGITGVAINGRIMTVKIDPLPLASAIARAVIYAADNGADVINMSFGMAYRSALMEEAMAYADSKGVVLCAAAGNSGSEEYYYPATSGLTIAVAASDDHDHITTTSTYGNHIDVCAPGSSILSLRADNTDMYASDYPYEPDVHIIDDIYYLASGTSMACPHVVGISANLRSLSPGISTAATRSIIQQSSDDIIDPFGAGWNLPGWDIHSGYGRVNLAEAVLATPDMTIKVDSPMAYQIVSGTVAIFGSAKGDDFINYFVDYGIGPDPDEWISIGSSSIAVTDGILAEWETNELNGIFTIRLHNGSNYEEKVTVYVANNNSAEIILPVNNDIIYGYAPVHINAFGEFFRSYLIEYRSFNEPENWFTLIEGSTPAYGVYVTGWATGELTDEQYILRLTVSFTDDTFITEEVTVNIQSLFENEHAWKSPISSQPSIIPNYGDFDNDGNNEIIVGTDEGIRLYDHYGTFLSDRSSSFPDNNFMAPIAVGDIDGDMIDDFVALGYNPPIVYSFPSSEPDFINYLANFPNINSYKYSEHQFSKLFLNDIDGDNRDEIIVHLPGSKSKTFIINSDGSQQYVFDYISEFLPADLNNDGFDELYAFYEGFSALRKIDLNGNTLDEVIIELNGADFNCRSLSAVDIDNDGQHELIMFGYFSDGGYYIFAFDDGFVPLEGWPHEMAIDPFVVPTTPVFGDLNNDGEYEYFTSYFDLDLSYILAWNLDGGSFLPGSINGHFAVTRQLGVANMLLLSDINDDSVPEIIACVNDDLFSVFPVQRLYAWDYTGRIVQGFPVVTASNISTSYRYTPIVGDINLDGWADICMTTADFSLVFINQAGNLYQNCSSPAPFWRYNRRMNGIAPDLTPCDPTDVPEDIAHLPTDYRLSNNYPNPFNMATGIDFSIPRKAHVNLSVFNILGQEIATLIDKELPAGNHSIIWQGENKTGTEIASGIYFYQLKCDDYVESKKMLLIK
jgi:hypothetical protein